MSHLSFLTCCRKQNFFCLKLLLLSTEDSTRSKCNFAEGQKRFFFKIKDNQTEIIKKVQGRRRDKKESTEKQKLYWYRVVQMKYKTTQYSSIRYCNMVQDGGEMGSSPL